MVRKKERKKGGGGTHRIQIAHFTQLQQSRSQVCILITTGKKGKEKRRREKHGQI